MKKLILLLIPIFLFSCTSYHNSISNPDNKEYVEEIAFNNNIKVNQVTQKQFNQRYNETKNKH